MFVSNEFEDYVFNRRSISFMNCGKEKGKLFIEGFEFTYDMPQKPYYLMFNSSDGKLSGYATALRDGVLLHISINNRDYKSSIIKFLVNFKSVVYDELRDALLIDDNFYLYFSDGVITHSNVEIKVNPGEKKSFFVMYVRKQHFDKYLMELSQNNAYHDYTKFVDNKYFTMVEHMLDSIDVLTPDNNYNSTFTYVKSYLIRMIKFDGTSYNLCFLNREINREEMFLFLPYLLMLGGEEIVRNILLNYKKYGNNYLYLYVLKLYIEHTRDFKFYEMIERNKLSLKINNPVNIIEKIAKIIYLNKESDEGFIDDLLKDILLEEPINRYVLLLFLPFSRGYLRNVLNTYLLKDNDLKNIMLSLERNVFDVGLINSEEVAAFSFFKLANNIADIKLSGVSKEVIVNLDYGLFDKAKIRCDDIVSLNISYNLINQRVNVVYDSIHEHYTLKMNLPEELEVSINGKPLGRMKHIIYEGI